VTVVRIELLHVPDCPNLVRVRTRVSEALDQAGVTASVEEVAIDTPEAAEGAGMHGSPTVLVEGRDPFPAGTTETSLSCRLYRTADGFDGAPTVAELIEAISR
jgi:hypothetical protein